MTEPCHLCFEKTNQLIHYSANNPRRKGVQRIIEQFCEFIFQDAVCTLTNICVKCWQKLNQFNDFCEKIRNIHQSLIEVGPEFDKIEFVDTENIVDIEDYDEEPIETNDAYTLDEYKTETVNEEGVLDAGEILVGPDRVPGSYSRKLNLRADVIKKLEAQLTNMTTEKHQLDVFDYDRISSFMKMECVICAEPFESFEESHKHFLLAHRRAAYWHCCKLVLESPYDMLDHIQYHERIDAFQCAACNKCFLTSNKLKYHIRRSHLQTDDPLTCVACTRSFRNQRALLVHQKSHIKVTCPHCNKLISTSNYDQHVRATHVDSSNAKQSELPSPPKRTPISYSGSKRRNQLEELSPDESLNTNTGTKKVRKNQNNIVLRKVVVRKNTPVRSVVSMEPNDNGLFECGVCMMEFKSKSLMFTHRNMVHA